MHYASAVLLEVLLGDLMYIYLFIYLLFVTMEASESKE